MRKINNNGLNSMMTLKSPSFVFLISRYILRLGQAAQKQQRPHCSNHKMYLEIREADERALKLTIGSFSFFSFLAFDSEGDSHNFVNRWEQM